MSYLFDVNTIFRCVYIRIVSVEMSVFELLSIPQPVAGVNIAELLTRQDIQTMVIVVATRWKRVSVVCRCLCWPP